ncbi:MAG: type 3 dihydrofolate reductase [Gammaproteobacteria bacterium]|nr:type 3 dihydrofolate reductase [Gammaproteobacteria bacterium]
MMISMIAAMGRNREIGKDNQLLWKLPNDMKWFVANTKGKPIIMGRKTFESFGSKPLPNRLNIVVTHDRQYHAPGAVVVHDVDQAIAAAGDVDEVMIIGGASFYQQLLPKADRLYLTYVDGEFDADAWFPEFNNNHYQIVSREIHQADEKHAYPYLFVVLQRLP